MTWLIVVHGDANFRVVAVADNEKEAIAVAEALSGMGRTFYWEVKEKEDES